MKERSLDIREHLLSGEYTFKDGVFFIPGAVRGAIYDLNSSNVYSINQSGCDVLTGASENPEFWRKLEAMNLATKEKGDRKKIVPELLQYPSLQFVWFEIVSDDCNESCIHCYVECMPPTYRKTMGISDGESETIDIRQKRNEKVSFERWKQLIDESYLLGCRRCQFIGGEPLLYRGENGETVFDLAEHAKNVGYEFIEIFTNATMLTPEKVQKIKTLGLNVAVSLYSDDETLHDSITKTPGSFKKTTEALKLLKESEIPVRVETVLMGPNEQTVEKTQRFVEEMGFSHKQPDVLRPKGRGDDPSIMPTKESVVKYSLMLSPSFTVTGDTLSRNISGHPCLLGKITITDNGDVLPCIFSRKLAVGSVRETTLGEIVTGQKLETIWRNTKDKVLVCQDCEYRYACFDCRPLSEGTNQGRGEYLSAPYPRCTYNPYTTEWAKGVWRVNEDGKPYYDETLRPVIEEVTTKGQNEFIQN
jgi:radical SAM protein with 4Fe4S-binding SPASM domain